MSDARCDKSHLVSKKKLKKLGNQGDQFAGDTEANAGNAWDEMWKRCDGCSTSDHMGVDSKTGKLYKGLPQSIIVVTSGFHQWRAQKLWAWMWRRKAVFMETMVVAPKIYMLDTEKVKRN